MVIEKIQYRLVHTFYISFVNGDADLGRHDAFGARMYLVLLVVGEWIDISIQNQVAIAHD